MAEFSEDMLADLISATIADCNGLPARTAVTVLTSAAAIILKRCGADIEAVTRLTSMLTAIGYKLPQANAVIEFEHFVED